MGGLGLYEERTAPFAVRPLRDGVPCRWRRSRCQSVPQGVLEALWRSGAAEVFRGLAKSAGGRATLRVCDTRPGGLAHPQGGGIFHPHGRLIAPRGSRVNPRLQRRHNAPRGPLRPPLRRSGITQPLGPFLAHGRHDFAALLDPHDHACAAGQLELEQRRQHTRTAPNLDLRTPRRNDAARPSLPRPPTHGTSSRQPLGVCHASC